MIDSTRFSLRILILLALAAGSAPLTAGASMFEDFSGARSIAMGGAHRGVGTSNETLVLNPAGLAIARRYALDAQYFWNSADRLSRVNLSAIDSKSGPVAGGVGFTHIRGNESGLNPSLNRISVGGGYNIAQTLAFGVTIQNLRGSYKLGTARHDVSMYNGTFGAILNLGDLLTLGFSYQNVLHVDETAFMPPTVGFGASFRLGGLVLAGDWVIDIRDGQEHHNAYNLGAEYFAFGSFPLRVGWRRDPQVDTAPGVDVSYLSGGVAWVSGTGALNLTGEKTLGDAARTWQVGGSFQFFL